MRGGTLGLAVLVLLQMLSSVASGAPGAASAPTGLVPHGAIYIYADYVFTPENGVTSGSGTAADPYVIEGWSIQSDISPGILVKDTTAAFVIRNLSVRTTAYDSDGIRLDHVRDARVQNVTAYGRSGVSLFFSTNVSVAASAASGWFYGASISNSTGVVVENNTAIQDMAVTGSSGVLIRSNTIMDGTRGVTIEESDNTTVSTNFVRYQVWWGLKVDGSRDVRLESNLVLDDSAGAWVLGSTRVNLSQNYFAENGLGVRLEDSTFVTMNGNQLGDRDRILLVGSTLAAFDTHTIGPDNTANNVPIRYVKDCAPGTAFDFHTLRASEVILVHCQDVSVSNLSVGGAQVGLQMAYVQGGDVFNNSFDSVTYRAVDLVASRGIVVHHNFFVDAVAEDDSAYNEWNLTYPFGGNWWSGYPGRDECSGPSQDRCPDPDGIGDMPAPIHPWTHSDGRPNPLDRYPLMWPLNRTGSPPKASIALASDHVAVGALVTLDASASVDPDGGPVMVRWDWEGDGVWDTWWSPALTAQHAYALPGTYNARVAVRDRDGYWSIATRSVTVAYPPFPVVGPAVLAVAVALLVAAWAVRRRTYAGIRRAKEAPPSVDSVPRSPPGPP